MPRSLRDTARTLVGHVSAGLATLGDCGVGKFGILVHHRVTQRVAGFPEPTFNVTPRQFRLQLEGLLRQGYQFWPLRRLVALHLAGESVPEKVVVLTFDDGYECVYSEAFPVMRELKIPATVFVNTAFLGSETPFTFDRWGVSHSELLPRQAFKPLGWDQCREMLHSGLVELGAHTHTHGDFRGRTADFESDLRTNIELLRSSFAIEDVSFAFPFGRRDLGYVSDELIEAARRAGVTTALTTQCELVDVSRDPFGWGRFNVYDWDSPTTIVARLRGWYDWAPRLEQQISGVARRLLPRSGAAR